MHKDTFEINHVVNSFPFVADNIDSTKKAKRNFTHNEVETRNDAQNQTVLFGMFIDGLSQRRRDTTWAHVTSAGNAVMKEM